MREQGFWIWQSRKVAEPWALRIDLAKERKTLRAKVALHAEWIPNESKVFRFEEMPVSRIVPEVSAICASLEHQLTKEDIGQIEDDLSFFRKAYYF